jgi:hypothetical protein
MVNEDLKQFQSHLRSGVGLWFFIFEKKWKEAVRSIKKVGSVRTVADLGCQILAQKGLYVSVLRPIAFAIP